MYILHQDFLGMFETFGTIYFCPLQKCNLKSPLQPAPAATPTWLLWDPLHVARSPIDFLVTIESDSFTLRTTALWLSDPHTQLARTMFLYFPVCLPKRIMCTHKNLSFVFVFVWSVSRSPRRVKDDETDERMPVVHWTLQHEAGECCHLAAMCRNARLEASVSVKATLGLVQTEKKFDLEDYVLWQWPFSSLNF
jgi:hypothetical protein